MKISVSILAAELIDLKRILLEMHPRSVDFIHLDVMDGHFVPQLSFGEGYAREIARATPIPLDVHLMVTEPEKEVPKYFGIKPQILTFHLEATHAPVRLAQSIRAENIQAGVAISPGTPVEAVEPLLDEIDVVLLMSVEPGYYGQKFLTNSIQRAQRLKRLIGNRDILLEADGGIDAQNIAALAKAGIAIVVSGGACFRSPNVNANVARLKAVSRAGHEEAANALQV